MAKKKSKVTVEQPWVPLHPATRVEKTPEQIAQMRAAATDMGYDPDEIEALAREPNEMWKNHRYTIIVERWPSGHVRHISLRRNDRKPMIPWRDLQRIKNELAGDDAEAVELFPSVERLVDCANQRHLWVWPPGEWVPVGFREGAIGTPEQAAAYGAVQS